MLQNIALWIEIVPLAGPHPVVLSYLHDLLSFLLRPHNFLLCSSIQISHDVRNKLISFITGRAFMEVASLEFIDCIGCLMKSIDFESVELLSVFEVRLNGHIHFTSIKFVAIQSVIESDVAFNRHLVQPGNLRIGMHSIT